MTRSMATYPSLSDECVFITGGATGIGAALVQAFAEQGSQVAFVDLDAKAGEALCDDLEARVRYRPWFRVVDVAETGALQKTIKEAATELGPVLALLNNVANDSRLGPLDVSPDDWRACMAVNLDAAFFAAQAAFASMESRRRGTIINFSSINVQLGIGGMTGYITAKAGLLGMTKALATDFGGADIRVNAIVPGWVATERQLDNWLTPEAEREWRAHMALKHRIEPANVAKLALFLASDDSALITGQQFVIDGGRT